MNRTRSFTPIPADYRQEGLLGVAGERALLPLELREEFLNRRRAGTPPLFPSITSFASCSNVTSGFTTTGFMSVTSLSAE